LARKRDFDGHDTFLGANPPNGAIIDFWTKSKPDPKEVKIAILDGSGKQVATVQTGTLASGMNRVVWNLHYDRAVPPTTQELAAAERQAASGGEPAEFNGPRVDPGTYTVRISMGTQESSTKFTVEEDPRITWFTSEDRVKRRAAIGELVELTKQADKLRTKFAAADAAVTGLEAAWKRPDAPRVSEGIKKEAEDLKKRLDDMRVTFVPRNQADQPSPEERKAELLKPEPDFVLPALLARINQQINSLDNFAAAPSDSDLKQITLIKAAVARADQEVAELRVEVMKFNEAMNAAKVPFVPVP
jgi:hypothetical protein